MTRLAKFLLAGLLLTVASVCWAACPEGTKNNYKGECVPIDGPSTYEQSSADQPTKSLPKTAIEITIDPTGRHVPDTYLGVWMPSVLFPEDEYSLQKREDLVSIGANAVAFGVIIPYDRSGRIFKREINYARLKETIAYYKEVGLAVVIALEPILARSQSEPKPLPTTTRGRFLQELEAVVRDLGDDR